jgi:hypothetical protein
MASATASLVQAALESISLAGRIPASMLVVTSMVPATGLAVVAPNHRGRHGHRAFQRCAAMKFWRAGDQ